MAKPNIIAMNVTKTVARNFLSNVRDEKVFCSHDGQIFKNLKELEQGLYNINDDIYIYHANGFKNDFANWVRDVIGDQELAKDLENAMSRWDASKKVGARVSRLCDGLD